MPTASHRLRAAAAGAALVAACGGLAACSGGDDGPSDAKSPDGSSPSGSPGTTLQTCTAEVTATGAAKVWWMGPAEVSLRGCTDRGPGPEARYVTKKDSANTLSIFSAGPDDFAPSLTLTVDGVSYNAGQDPDGLDAQEDGTEADVDVELVGPDDASGELQATITCDTSAPESSDGNE